MKTGNSRFLQTFFLIILSVVVLTACNGGLTSYKGAAKTDPDQIITLQKGDQQGIWKTNELALNYHYQMSPESLRIYGTVTLVGGFAIGFSSVDRLVVHLSFIDNQGTVIRDDIIYSADANHWTEYIPMKFDRTIPIPPDARAISFIYDGALSNKESSVTIGFPQ